MSADFAEFGAPERDSVYTDRAHALALLVASDSRRPLRRARGRLGRLFARLMAPGRQSFPAVLAYNDEKLPGLPVLYIRTPAGQICFHIHPDDVALFLLAGVEIVAPDDLRAQWDGCGKDEYHRRIQRIIAAAGPVRRGVHPRLREQAGTPPHLPFPSR